MSAAAALPQESGNNAAKLKTNNALTTEFLFDTAAANFESTGITPSKDLDERKIQRPPHSSLLATPLHRLSGQVKKNPSPTILESKYLARPTAATPFARKSTPAPLSAGKGAAASPSYSTPLSKKFTAEIPTTRPPSASLVSASSDIKARLRQLAAITPITTSGGSSRSHSCTPATAPMASSSFSATRDFRIAAASGRTPSSAESLAVRSRANHMQSELQLRDLEVHKLAAAAAEARKERDAQKLRADKLEAIATMRTSPCGLKVSSPYAGTNNSSTPNSARTASFYQNQIPQQQAQHATNSPSRSNAPTTNTSQVPSDAQAAVSELRREAETLRQQVEMAASELQGHRARADAAEERARYAEARAGAECSASEANENELRGLQQKVASMQNEVRRLATDLAIAEDRAGLAEASLAEERNRSRRGGATGSNSGSNGINNTAALTEVALTAQVRALATQLKVAKTEAATTQQELTALKAETQGYAAVHEGTTASILSTNRELEAALAQASQNLETRDEELEQARGAVAQLAAENAALHAALKDRDEHYTALEYRSSNNKNAQDSESYARANAVEAQLVATQQELKAAKTRIADLEHAMSKNSHHIHGGFNSNSSTGPSPLRDIVGSLRTELEDRELRLAAAEEELATERRRAADLHRQVLDQAVEIDDLQRETHHSDDGLRKELEQARREAHAAAQELAKLRQVDALTVGDAGNATAAGIELKALREELDARESEVMALQGQLHMLVSMNNSNGRGSMGSGGEVENWLMGP